MKRPLLVLFAIILIAGKAEAQMPYAFTAYHQTYVPLTSGAVMNPGYVWNSNDYYTFPIGFPFQIDTMLCTNMFLSGGGSVVSDTANVPVSGFVLTDASLDDRAYTLGTTPLSPIRWVLSGTAPNRILKVETVNAGFDQQLIDSGFMKDSVNLQVWYYEDSDIVELRYGPSHITGTGYFLLANTIAGYIKDIDTNGNGTFYALGGVPTNPVVQTVPLAGGNPTGLMVPLSGFPASGQVYRFARIDRTGVPSVFTSDNIKVYPTSAQSELNVSYKGSETLNFEVMSVNGSKMNIEGKAVNGTTTININELPSGIYLLRLSSATDSKVYKFVKM
jgi:Secretion system C-terminal sorting domain